MIRKLLLVLVSTACLLPTAGCWNAKEVNDLAIITGAGIDLTEDGRIELSVEIYLTSPGGTESDGPMTGQPNGDKGTSVIRTVHGINMADAASRLQKMISRKVFWGQAEVFLFGERMARAGLEEPMDFMLRHTASRERSQVFVANGPAKDVLLLTPPVDRSLSDALVSMAEQQTGLNITMKELAQMMVGKSRAAVLPIVHIYPEKDLQDAFPYIAGMAVIKEGRMIGKLDEYTTRGVMWLRNEMKHATVTVKPDESGGYVSLHLLRNHTRLIPSIQGDRWIMTVRITGQDDIVENTSNLDLSEPDHLEQVEREMERFVEERVKLALDTAQKKLKVDIFGFADAFWRRYPKQWMANASRWDEIFPEMEVRLETDIRIARPGLIGKNFFPRQEQR
ncbi:Ger(x)C family spore germination protein [Thermobacillus sp. ZCTH02-B1]|uniref:Ger(x)C family spore germination protein n=1 Tax=Thermobacillus sp. ZCTH02-B1 TaxID=1858795 RepID=UPI0025F01190|nr:Ger(x)C family spore germination protein [Thermobacillus sp. ZCTH02-B1]